MKQESLLGEVIKHLRWQQTEKQHKKKKVELRGLPLHCPECHVLSTSPASLASVQQPERWWQQRPQKEWACRSTTRHRRGDARGTEISVGQDEESERESGGQNVGLNLSRFNILLPGFNSPAATSIRGRILHFGCLNKLLFFISSRYMHGNCLWIAHQCTTILWMLEFLFIFLFSSPEII